jgi:hypothetical protein
VNHIRHPAETPIVDFPNSLLEGAELRRVVLINTAAFAKVFPELVQAACLPKKRGHVGLNTKALQGYKDYVRDCIAKGKQPKRAEDEQFMLEIYDLARAATRKLRNEYAPQDWRERGRPRKLAKK